MRAAFVDDSERRHPAAPQRGQHPTTPAAPALQRLAALQRRAGNQAVTSLLQANLLQARALPALPGGPATRPLPRPSPTSPGPAPTTPTPSVPAAIARTGPAMSALFTSLAIQPAAEPAPATGAVPAGLPDAVTGLGSGEQVPAGARARFESAYGYRLDPVRVHHGDAAAQATDALGASAVTLGDHILVSPRLDLHSAAGEFTLGHELAHVVQSRRNPAAGLGRVSRAGDASEHEATRASLAARAGQPTDLVESAGEDPQPVVWWVLALIGLGIGAAVAGTAAVTGHGVEENQRNQVRENRGTEQDVLAWVPIVGSVQDIWEAESNLQLALGVSFLAFDVATLGGAGTMARALCRVPAATLRVLRAGAARTAAAGAERGVVVAGEQVAETAAEQAARQLAERGGVVSAGTAADEVARALSREGAMVAAMEGGHAVLYANRAGQIIRVHGGPLFVRAQKTLAEGAGEVAGRMVTSGGGHEGKLTAYAVIEGGAPLTLQALEAMPSGARGVLEAVGRMVGGGPTSCGVLQGAGIEASGLTAEMLQHLLPAGGASGRFIPITMVDHWLQTGAGRLVEGGTAKMLYGATGVLTQATMGIAAVAGRVLGPQAGQEMANLAAAPGPAPQGANGAMPASLANLGGDAAGAGGQAVDLETARTMEHAAVTIVSRWGQNPGADDVAAIREALPGLAPGWLVWNRATQERMRSFLRRSGIAPSAVEAILR